jgi:gas vesicle protein
MVGGTITGAVWGAGAALLPSAGATTTNKVDANITVKAETDDPHGLAEKIAERLSKMLTQAHTRNLGEGEGTASSSFVSGMGIP